MCVCVYVCVCVTNQYLGHTRGRGVCDIEVLSSIRLFIELHYPGVEVSALGAH